MAIRSSRGHVCVVTIFLVIGIAGCTNEPSIPDGPTPPEKPNPPSAQTIAPLESAVVALNRGDLSTASSAIKRHLLANPDDWRGLEVAGDIALAQQVPAQAIEFYEGLVELNQAAPAAVYDKLGRQYVNMGQPYEALDVLRRSVSAHPQDAKVRADFAGLSAALGMVRDSAEHLRWLLRRGKGGMNELIMLADLNAPQTDQAMCDYALKKNPADLRPQYAQAIPLAYEAKWQQVAKLLKPVVEKHGNFGPAWALYGRALVETNAAESQFEQWQENRPQESQGWTSYWMAAGLHAEKMGNAKQAALAFYRAIQINDCHGEALNHLATNLALIGKADEAKQTAQRAQQVNSVRDSVESLFSWRKNSQQAALQVASAMQELGRPWEAEAWARASMQMTQKLIGDAREQHRRFFDQLTSSTPWQSANPIQELNLAELGEFQWETGVTKGSQSPSEETGPAIQFTNAAEQVGLKHICQIDKSNPESSLWIHQSNAGGAGVIDFDLDGWPDIYLTNVDGKPMQDNSTENSLYRNLSGKFMEVTHPTGVGDQGFSQGVAVGDYNCDGFPDLWVANIGLNRLYRNNGDGSFQDVTVEAGLQGEQWTTSIAIADINMDSLPDLFEVQYCQGAEVFAKPCIDDEMKEARSCSPLAFPADRDRVWENDGQGSYRNVSSQWLDESEGFAVGHGLGLVVGHIDSQPGNDVYVANDMTANHFWSVNSSSPDFSLAEQGAVRGLAVSNRSRSQASMGIALGDADADGDFDLFVTHFTDDHNTFYEQVGEGLWFDRTSNIGLADPSVPMLAFGTQWLDANNDGQLELIIANGNVDDFQHQGHPLRMKPQFFRRTGGGTWQPALASELGAYFEQPVIGRSLVTLDVNRDAKQDVIITHIYDPVAILVNQTDAKMKSIRLFLKGRESERDAVGAVVEVRTGDQKRRFQLTAGDGFQCSNERCIRIGLGQQSHIEGLSIQWPSGRKQAVGKLAGDADYLVVEEIPEAFELR